MAQLPNWTKENDRIFEEWLDSEPPAIQEMARKLPPSRLYRIKITGKRCTIVAYCEDGTVRVSVTGEYNRVVFSHDVFGLSPDHIEECELPAPGEDLGDNAAEAGYTEDDIREILIPRMSSLHEQGE